MDPANSKAFMSSSVSLGIHVKDQIVADIIVRRLKELKGVHDVWRREEIYQGPFLENAPEILLLPDFDHGYSIGTTMVHPNVVAKRVDFWHRPHGVVAIYGRGVTPTQLNEIKTVDVVPTILKYMGLPLPADTDGAPLNHIYYPTEAVEKNNYLKHWQLIRQVQIKRSKLVLE